MTIKNIRGWIAMFTVALLTVFVFTACEEKPEPVGPDPEPPVENPIPRAVDSLKAGATSETSIKIQWKHSPDRDSVWFKEYHVEIAPPPPALPWVDTIPKNINTVDFTGLNNATRYNFTVYAVSDSAKVSTGRSIEWAASKFFTTVNGTSIKVYGHASSFGSGLRFYGFEGATEPSIHNVANGANWNLGLHTNAAGDIRFGSASVVGPMYNSWGSSTTPLDAYITDVMYDDAALGGLMLDKDLSTLTFTKKAIDLKTTTNAQGAVFFARVGSGATANYAKVIVRKSGGNFLQGTAPNQFIEVVISYQTAAGVPYAKIFAGE